MCKQQPVQNYADLRGKNFFSYFFLVLTIFDSQSAGRIKLGQDKKVVE